MIETIRPFYCSLEKAQRQVYSGLFQELDVIKDRVLLISLLCNSWCIIIFLSHGYHLSVVKDDSNIKHHITHRGGQRNFSFCHSYWKQEERELGSREVFVYFSVCLFVFQEIKQKQECTIGPGSLCILFLLSSIHDLSNSSHILYRCLQYLAHHQQSVNILERKAGRAKVVTIEHSRQLISSKHIV